jgi:hypothetical protein
MGLSGLVQPIRVSFNPLIPFKLRNCTNIKNFLWQK